MLYQAAGMAAGSEKGAVRCAGPKKQAPPVQAGRGRRVECEHGRRRPVPEEQGVYRGAAAKKKTIAADAKAGQN